MKFYSCSNDGGQYAKAVSLENVRSVERNIGSGASKIRYSVTLNYHNGKTETFIWLNEEESKRVYKEIVDLLNK